MRGHRRGKGGWGSSLYDSHLGKGARGVGKLREIGGRVQAVPPDESNDTGGTRARRGGGGRGSTNPMWQLFWWQGWLLVCIMAVSVMGVPCAG